MLIALLMLVCSSSVYAAIWRPSATTTFQWQLDSGHINTNVDAHVYDVDLFDVSTSTIHSLQSSGKKVICYFSAGSYEGWRSDHSAFPSDVIGHKLDGWNEKWLDIRDGRVKSIMSARLKKAQDKGCDGVEPDNVDGYTNDNGFHLTAHDQLTFNKWLATEAHNHGLSVGLKNDVDQIQELQSHFDWALNEECVNYNECKKYQPFIDAHKAVFHVEYVDSHSSGSSKKSSVCHSSRRPQQFITLIKDWDLTDWRLTC
ncbi:uncharacterized protein [Mytilus edulis]|uniref:uncharacterized protein n=1 Tax=Mytilus edulis TaxID=6550 RepID=UPI0039EF5947